MSFAVVKDSYTNFSKSVRTDEIPVVDITQEAPVKGKFAYNRSNEIAPGINGILYYADGTKWIPLLGGENIIAGTGITISVTGGVATISTDLAAGPGISLTGTHPLTITNTSPATLVSLTSVGPGTSLVALGGGAGPALETKSLVAGSGITFTGSDGTTQVTINSHSTLTQQIVVIDGMSSGNFPVPASAIAPTMTITAGGGGGGQAGAADATANGGGGGGGSGGEIIELEIQPGDTINYSLGIGGSGGSGGGLVGGSGGSGGSSSFSITRGATTGPSVTLNPGLGGGGGADLIGGVAGAGGITVIPPAGFVVINSVAGTGGGVGGGNVNGSGGGSVFGSPFQGGSGGAVHLPNGGGGGGGSTWVGLGGDGYDGNGGSATVATGGSGGSGGGGSGQNGNNGAVGRLVIRYWA